jgi:hypothetical protein
VSIVRSVIPEVVQTDDSGFDRLGDRRRERITLCSRRSFDSELRKRNNFSIQITTNRVVARGEPVMTRPGRACSGRCWRGQYVKISPPGNRADQE